MDPRRVFFLGSGSLFLALAVLGEVFVRMGERDALGGLFLFDTPHNVVHVVLGVVALAAGAVPMTEPVRRRAALAFGVVLLALAVVGFANGDLFGYPRRFGWPLHLELGENLLHLILGGWGAYVATQENKTS